MGANNESALFECGMIDPSTVSWSRVMIICRLLALNGKDRGDCGTEEEKTLNDRYRHWVYDNMNREDVEFNLAMMIMFDVAMNPHLTQLAESLFLEDGDDSLCELEKEFA